MHFRRNILQAGRSAIHCHHAQFLARHKFGALLLLTEALLCFALRAQVQAPVPAFDELGKWPGYSVGSATALEVVGNKVYIAAGTAGLVIFDVSNLENPARLGALDTAGVVSAIDVQGNYAFVLEEPTGFMAIDITDPGNAFAAGTLPISATALAIRDQYAYLAFGPNAYGGRTNENGLFILDIANPTVPKLVGKEQFTIDSGPCRKIVVSGNRAFVAAGDAGLQIFDITDPTKPENIGAYTHDALGRPREIRLVELLGNDLAIAANPRQLVILDLADVRNPKPIGHFIVGTPIQAIAVREETALILTKGAIEGYDAPSALSAIDLSNPAAPKIVAEYRTIGFPLALDLEGENCFFVEGGNAIRVMDVSTPEALRLIGGFATGGPVVRVKVADGYAYLADGELQIVDVRNPANPVRVATHGPASDLDVSGNLCCVIHEASMRIVDVSDPAAPKTLGTYDESSGPGRGFNQVIVSGSRAYLAFYTNGEGTAGGNLRVIDLSDPANPRRLGTSNSGAYSRLAIDGDTAYVNSFGKIQILDIQTGVPAFVGSIDGVGGMGMAVAGDYLYLANWGDGLLIARVSNPQYAAVIGSCSLPGRVSEVRIAGHHAYLTGDGNLYVVDVTDPESPEFLGTYSDEGEIFDVAVHGDNVYLADGSGGFKALDVRFGLPQTVTFTIPKELPVSDTPIALSANSNSGLPIVFQVRSGPAEIVEGNQLTITGAGEVRIRAEQSGNQQFLPAFVERAINSPAVAPLNILGSGPILELFWNSGDTTIQLQQTSSIAPDPAWTGVLHHPVRTASETKVRLAPTSSNTFFRLTRH